MFRRPFGTAALVLALAAGSAAVAEAQEPAPADTARAPADTTSLETLEARLMGELGAVDTTPTGRAEAATTASAGTATLNPDISAIADFLVDLSPDASTLENGDRYQLREMELGVQGAVDPYFRYDAFLAVHGDAIEVEEGYASTLALPVGLQVKVGKMRLPFGKSNLTHRPELQMFDYPLALQEYLGEEGLSSTGVWASVIGDPLGFYQELSVVAANGLEEEEADSAAAPPDEGGKSLGADLADRLWLAHLRNSIDLSEASNLEFGASWGTGVVDVPARTRVELYGLDAIWRWKPPRLSKYRSAIIQSEAYWRRDLADPEARFGAYVFGQWQLSRRWYAGGRLDRLDRMDAAEGTLTAGQAMLRWFPTEFSQIRLVLERRKPEYGDATDRVVVQTTFALGPHRPHAF